MINYWGNYKCICDNIKLGCTNKLEKDNNMLSRLWSAAPPRLHPLWLYDVYTSQMLFISERQQKIAEDTAARFTTYSSGP